MQPGGDADRILPVVSHSQLAHDVVADPMGGEANRVLLVTAQGVTPWPRASKDEVAARLADWIAERLA